MRTSDQGVDFICAHEGLRLRAYLCPAKVWTIGYGHTGEDVVEGLTITKARARELLVQDLEKAERAVLALSVPLQQHQFDALVSLVFNIGPTAFAKSTLVRKLKDDDYNGAANQFLKWVYAGKRQVPGLVSRRARERDMFLKGVYS